MLRAIKGAIGVLLAGAGISVVTSLISSYQISVNTGMMSPKGALAGVAVWGIIALIFVFLGAHLAYRAYKPKKKGRQNHKLNEYVKQQ